MKTTSLKSPMNKFLSPSFEHNEGIMTMRGYVPPRKKIDPQRMRMALEEAQRLVAEGRARGLPDLMDQYNPVVCWSTTPA